MTDFKVFDIFIPGIFLHCTQRKAYPTTIAVNTDDFDGNFFANLDQVIGVLEVVPAHFAEMDQTICAANIDECAEISNAGDTTCADITFLQIFQNLIADHIAGFVTGSTFAENKALSLAVNFDHADINFFADKFFEFLFRSSARDVEAAAQAELRSRNETTNG